MAAIKISVALSRFMGNAMQRKLLECCSPMFANISFFNSELGRRWTFVGSTESRPTIHALQLRRVRTGFAIFRGGCTGLGDKRAAFHGCDLRESDIGHFAGQTFEREFFS